jgi:GINS complex subunit 4
MDIDDILADLDRDAAPQDYQDLQAFTRAWVTERVAPELLPWPENLVGRIMGRIGKQVCSLFR